VDGLSERSYFFATLNGIADDPFHFTTKDHKDIAYPFPDNIALRGPVLPGVLSSEIPPWIIALGPDMMPVYRVYVHVSRVNRKLQRFYARQFAKGS
jgi:hypothetical protein